MNYKTAIFAAIAITTVASCHSPEPVLEKAKPKPIDIITLTPHRLSSTTQLPGVVEPFQVVQIYPRISGFVKSVSVDRGSMVKKGATLLVLEAPEQTEHLAAARLKYAEGLAMLQASKDKYDRLLETSKTPGTVSPFDLASAQSRMKADEAMVQGAQANVRAQEALCAYLTVTAPFDGVITERNVHPGALVGPGAQNIKPLLVLQQQDKFRLVVSLPEQVSSQVRDKDKVTYTINAIPGTEYTGLISRSSGSLSDRYRSETIEIDIPNNNKDIKAGMYAEVRIPTAGNVNAFIVPKTAVVTTTERKYVITTANNKTRWVDVTTGNEKEDSTEVFGALSVGDHVIINADYNIKDAAPTGATASAN